MNNRSNEFSQEPESSPQGTPLKSKGLGVLAGVDYGTVRIGVALSDHLQMMASPYAIYVRRNDSLDADWFRRLVEAERVVKFIVGLPLHLDGRVSEKSREAGLFGDWLAKITDCPVEYFDERFTSVEAERLLGVTSLTAGARKKRIDKIAAAILLSNYLERGIATHRGESIDD